MDNIPQWALDMGLEIEGSQSPVARDLEYEIALAPSLRKHKASLEEKAAQPRLIKRFSDGELKSNPFKDLELK